MLWRSLLLLLLLLLLTCRYRRMREGDGGLGGRAGEEGEGVGAKGGATAQLGMTHGKGRQPQPSLSPFLPPSLPPSPVTEAVPTSNAFFLPTIASFSLV